MGHQGTQTQARPGHGHVYGIHINQREGRPEATFCRCHNPEAHGSAYAVNVPPRLTIEGEPLTWEQEVERCLDIAGTDTINRREYIAIATQFIDSSSASRLIRNEDFLEWSIRSGVLIE